MIRNTNVVLMLAVVACFTAACTGGDFDQDEETVLSLECLEPRGNARGALLEFEWMVEGRQPVDTGTLGGVRTFGRQLADEVSAPAAIRQDLDRWESALAAWRDSLSAIEPQIRDGYFVEPDTTELDRRLLAELTPLAKRLGVWIEGACEGTVL
ncbi:MAG TPA: hypothetical protein VKZ91_01430 [Woeseiaceae bacterium]|nr:hypothetical protein [Woeseiaceae bacterium]